MTPTRRMLRYFGTALSIGIACQYAVPAGESKQPQKVQPGVKQVTTSSDGIQGVRQLASELIATGKAGDPASALSSRFRQALTRELNAALQAGDNQKLGELYLIDCDQAIAFGNLNPETPKKAVEHFERLKTDNSANISRGWNRLAIMEARMNHGKYAQDLFAKSLKSAENGSAAQAEDLVQSLDLAAANGLTDRSRNKDDVYVIFAKVNSFIDRKYPNRPDLKARALKAQAQSKLYVSAKDSLALAQQAIVVAEQVKPKNDELLFSCYLMCGKAASHLADNAMAIANLEKALTYPSSNRDRDTLLGTLADAYANAGGMEKAEALKAQQLALWEKHPGDSKLNLINALSNQVAFYRSRGKSPRAISLMERSVKLHEELNPADHSSGNMLADMYMEARRFDAAIPLLEVKLKAQRENARSYGAGYVNYEAADTLVKLGVCYTKSNRLAEAGKSFAEAREFYASRPTIQFLTDYVDYLNAAGKGKEAATARMELDKLRKIEIDTCPACGRG